MLQIVLREAQEDPELAGGSFTEELTATPAEDQPRPGAALGRTRHPRGVAPRRTTRRVPRRDTGVLDGRERDRRRVELLNFVV